MAIIKATCRKCGGETPCDDNDTSSFWNARNSCAKCEEKKKNEYFARLSSMTLEERVRQLEEQMYNLQRSTPATPLELQRF
jgi:hypothetical protein